MSDVAYPILGIDQSLTSSGVVIIKPAEGDRLDLLEHKSCSISPKSRGLSRLFEVESRLKTMLPGVAMVVMEGYAYGGRGAVFSLGELGGCIKMLVRRENIRLLIVSPATLKKFVTGSGVAKKNKMILGVYKRWGVEFDTDDEADAYALARVGELVQAVESGKAVSKSDKQVYKSVVKHTSLALHEEE